MITQSSDVNHTIAHNPAFGRFVYDSLQRFNAADYGHSLYIGPGEVESIYDCGVYGWSVVLSQVGQDITIRFNYERIAEMDATLTVINMTLCP